MFFPSYAGGVAALFFAYRCRQIGDAELPNLLQCLKAKTKREEAVFLLSKNRHLRTCIGNAVHFFLEFKA